MSNNSYMGDRNIGFLWDDERELIDSYRPATFGRADERSTPEFESLTEENAMRVGHRLRNGPASPQGLGEILEVIRHDLYQIERFWDDAMVDEDGRFEFENIVLPANQDRIEKLHQLLEVWLERAESEQLQADQQVLNEKLEPLRNDLEPDDNEEYQARLDALAALIRENELRAILEWIAANPGKKVRQEAYRDTDWRWLASRKLRTMHGVVENDGPWDHCYRLTERGEAVVATLQRLTEGDERRDDEEKRLLKDWLSRIERYRTGG